MYLLFLSCKHPFEADKTISSYALWEAGSNRGCKTDEKDEASPVQSCNDEYVTVMRVEDNFLVDLITYW
jgi:hypothetical protein